jgi:hypothetical protein
MVCLRKFLSHIGYPHNPFILWLFHILRDSHPHQVLCNLQAGTGRSHQGDFTGQWDIIADTIEVTGPSGWSGPDFITG